MPKSLTYSGSGSGLDIDQDPLPHRDASKKIDEAEGDDIDKQRDYDVEKAHRHGNDGRGERGSQDSSSVDRIYLDDRKSEVEITPVEAFKVSVAGDQSPCMCSITGCTAFQDECSRLVPEVAACVPNTDDPTALVNSTSLDSSIPPHLG